MVTTRSTESRIEQLEKVVEDLSAAFTNFQTEYQTFRISTDTKLDALLTKLSIPTDSTENNESGGSHVANPEEESCNSVQVMPSMDLPSFDGTEALSWLARAEQYFMVHETPLEVVYGRPPPVLRQFLPGEIRMQSLAQSLQSRDEMLANLRSNLERAQLRMAKEANKHRRDVEFQVGDRVYLKFRPYRQKTLYAAKNRKLAPRFFGPFEVEGRIGAVAYRLKLPPDPRVHPVVHVSLLKKAIGAEQAEPPIPPDMLVADPPFLPESVLDRRVVSRANARVEQVLIKWSGLGVDEATWMDSADVRGQFPYFSLEDKAVSTGGAIDSEKSARQMRGQHGQMGGHGWFIRVGGEQLLTIK